MANLLILDASSSWCSVTLLRDSDVIDLCEQQPRRQAQRLLPMIDEVLQQAGIERTDIDGIAFARGPGSFTGIRIAVSVVQGAALGLDVPVFGFSTLQLLACQAAVELPSTERLACVMDAHMGEVFWGVYQNHAGHWQLQASEQVGAPEQCLAALQAASAETAGQLMLVGNGVRLLPPFEAPLQTSEGLSALEPVSRYAADLVLDAWQQQRFGDVEQFPPVYLRDSVAWKKLDEQPSLLRRD